MDSKISMLRFWYTMGCTMLVPFCPMVQSDGMDSGISMLRVWYTVGCTILSYRTTQAAGHFGTFWDCFGHLLAILDMFGGRGTGALLAPPLKLPVLTVSRKREWWGDKNIVKKK